MKTKKKVLVVLATAMLAITLIAPTQANASGVLLVSWSSNGSFFVESTSFISHTQSRAYSNGHLGPWRNNGTHSLATSVCIGSRNVSGFDLR